MNLTGGLFILDQLLRIRAVNIFAVAFLIFVFIFAGCEAQQTRSEGFFDEDGALTVKNITQDREMKQYAQGGHFWCRTRFTGAFGNDPDRLEGEKKVRDFIWQHWIEKKRGYIKLSCAGTDVSNTTHYFIEPNEKGEWSIIRRNIFRASDDKITRNDSVLNLIERLENKEKGYWFLVLRPSNEEFTDKLPSEY
ncbi:MAG TPA: hypothetical protein VNB22_08590 [Pyrinomonadaceae bacterium]|jgi:hypothetical protein|nr:hypothetical protein [Pyrinomonadaceae bacterium]